MNNKEFVEKMEWLWEGRNLKSIKKQWMDICEVDGERIVTLMKFGLMMYEDYTKKKVDVIKRKEED